MKLMICVLFIMLFTISCDNNNDENCPDNIKLPLHTNSGVNVMALKINNKIWIGDEVSLRSGTLPSFRIEPMYYKSDKNGNLLSYSIVNINFISGYTYDCEEFKETGFVLQMYVNLETKQFCLDSCPPPKIDMKDFVNAKSYFLNLEKPYTFIVEVDTVRQQASATFSGIFTEYDTGEELTITDGFFDMQESWAKKQGK